MKNKAQITLFVILGFVILIVIGFIYYIYGTANTSKIKVEIEKSAKIPFELVSINNYLKICFQNLAYEGMDYISERGGYFSLP